MLHKYTWTSQNNGFFSFIFWFFSKKKHQKMSIMERPPKGFCSLPGWWVVPCKTVEGEKESMHFRPSLFAASKPLVLSFQARNWQYSTTCCQLKIGSYMNLCVKKKVPTRNMMKHVPRHNQCNVNTSGSTQRHYTNLDSKQSIKAVTCTWLGRSTWDFE